MPVNFTLLTDGQAATQATFNAPLNELDTAIENIGTGAKTLAAPSIASHANAQHNHQNGAGGGKITEAAINSGATPSGRSLVADGAGNATWANVGGVPTGVSVPFAGAVAPTGWLLCNGQAVNRVTYAALFTVIGTTYGIGDGVSTFNLPDLRGRAWVGRDQMGAGAAAGRLPNIVNNDTTGTTGGASQVALSVTELPAHNHPGAAGFVQQVAGAFAVGAGATFTVTTLPSQGGNAAHQNMPPFVIGNWIIKT
jgi:microcystin-dependent protein